MRFLCLFTFHQLADVWCKFANSASKVIRCDTIEIADKRKIYLFKNKAKCVKYKTANPGFCEKMEATHIPPERPLRTTGGEPLVQR